MALKSAVLQRFPPVLFPPGLQAYTQIPQKICYNFALSALQTQGAATISTHIANTLCFNESTNTVLKAGTRYCRNQLCRLLYYFTHHAE